MEGCIPAPLSSLSNRNEESIHQNPIPGFSICEDAKKAVLSNHRHPIGLKRGILGHTADKNMQGGETMQQKYYRLKWFLRSFLLSSAVLMAVFMSAMAWISGRDSQQQVTAPVENQPVYTPETDEPLNILILECSTRAKPIETVWLIRLDPLQGKVPVAALPLESAAALDGRSGTLADFYDYGGIQMAIRAVEGTFGIPVDRYIRCDRETFSRFADVLGGIVYEISEPLALQMEEAGQHILPGLQTLDGRRILQLLHFPCAEGRLFQTNRQAVMAALLFSAENARAGLSGDTLYYDFINDIDTNISAFDYDYRRRGLEVLFSKEDAVYPVELSGTFDLDGRFLPDSAALLALREAFS